MMTHGFLRLGCYVTLRWAGDLRTRGSASGFSVRVGANVPDATGAETEKWGNPGPIFPDFRSSNARLVLSSMISLRWIETVSGQLLALIGV
jgi:hypothetical protein